MFPLAVISDIHGNIWALESVLEDIEKRWILDIVNLGDVLYGPLEPARTADLLMSYSIPTVRGNEDRLLVQPPTNPSSTLQFTLDNLCREHIDWMRTFQYFECFCNVLLFHGSPRFDTEYLFNKVTENGIGKRTVAELENILSNKTNPLILCGHDHLQNELILPNRQTIVNPGSVGCPAFDDDKPFPHKIENFTPNAKYAIIHEDENGFRTEFVELPYNNEAASDTAKKNGFEDWAYWLKTGTCR